MSIKTVITAITLILAGSHQLMGQNFIGKEKEEVRRLMTEHYPQLAEDEVNNKAYNLLRFIDRWGEQTIIFVFNERDACTYSKHMYDYSLEEKILRQLNKTHTIISDTAWSYQADGQKYLIRLKRDDWYFVLDTRKEE